MPSLPVTWRLLQLPSNYILRLQCLPLAIHLICQLNFLKLYVTVIIPVLKGSEVARWSRVRCTPQRWHRSLPLGGPLHLAASPPTPPLRSDIFVECSPDFMAPCLCRALQEVLSLCSEPQLCFLPLDSLRTWACDTLLSKYNLPEL